MPVQFPPLWGAVKMATWVFYFPMSDTHLFPIRSHGSLLVIQAPLHPLRSALALKLTPQMTFGKTSNRLLNSVKPQKKLLSHKLLTRSIPPPPPIYLRALLNRATGQYSASISALITHLFDTYGKITPQQVKAKEMELYNMHYDISQPVDPVFNNIDDLSELADHAGSPMTAQQMIDLAYVIFSKQPILQQDLCLWNRRPLVDRTWPNMMQHLCDAQTDLSYYLPSANIYNQQPVHQANVTTMADLIAQRLFDEYNQTHPAVVPPIPTPPPFDHHTDVANSLQRRKTDLQSREAAMMSQMRDMMLTLMRTNGNQNTNTNNSPHGGGGSNNRNNHSGRNTPGQGSSGRSGGCGNNRSPTHLYCWSLGAGAHTGTDCNTPAAGHQSMATFANMMSGSTNRCYCL
jgi:hypothetical protein